MELKMRIHLHFVKMTRTQTKQSQQIFSVYSRKLVFQIQLLSDKKTADIIRKT